MKVKVNDVTLIDLGSMTASAQKTLLLENIGSGLKAADPTEPFNPVTVMDDNSTDAYMAYAIYFTPN